MLSFKTDFLQARECGLKKIKIQAQNLIDFALELLVGHLFVVVKFGKHLGVLVFVQEAHYDGDNQVQDKGGKNFVDVKNSAAKIVPSHDCYAANDKASDRSLVCDSAPVEGKQDEGAKASAKARPSVAYQAKECAPRGPDAYSRLRGLSNPSRSEVCFCRRGTSPYL